MRVPPNKQMQPTGRTVPSSARALLADGDQGNVGLCGRGLEGLQLICKSFEWFEQFATDVDDQGHFLYQDWHEIAGMPAAVPDVVAVAPRGLTLAELYARQAQTYAAMSTAERLDYLMRFSDFHLSLVSLVSPEAATRIGRGRGLTAEQERNALTQMRVIVAAMRQTRGEQSRTWVTLKSEDIGDSG